MQMNKYLNLVEKDMLVGKKIALFFVYGPFLLLFLPKDFLLAGVNTYFLQPVLLLVYLFLTFYLLEEEKCKGTALFITTTYTRLDIVRSRYVICFIVALIQLILNTISILIVAQGAQVLSFMTISLTFFFMSLFISVLVPISFKFRANMFPIASVVFWIAIVFLTGQNDKVLNYLSGIFNINILGILFFIIDALIVILSIYISKKVYLNKDL